MIITTDLNRHKRTETPLAVMRELREFFPDEFETLDGMGCRPFVDDNYNLRIQEDHVHAVMTRHWVDYSRCSLTIRKNARLFGERMPGLSKCIIFERTRSDTSMEVLREFMPFYATTYKGWDYEGFVDLCRHPFTILTKSCVLLRTEADAVLATIFNP